MNYMFALISHILSFGSSALTLLVSLSICINIQIIIITPDIVSLGRLCLDFIYASRFSW